MILAILFAGMAVASPYFTVMAMRAREKVVILDPGGTLIYAPLLGLEEAGELRLPRPACLSRAPATQPGRAGFARPLSDSISNRPGRRRRRCIRRATRSSRRSRFTRRSKSRRLTSSTPARLKDGAGHSYEAVSVRTEGNLIRTGTLNGMEFREPVKFSMEFLFIRNPDLLGNGRLPLVVQDFKYKETPL